MATDTLTDTERELLDLERTRFKYAAAKDTVVLERFAMTGVRHAQVLNALIDRPAAEAHAPQLVRRLRRLRADRAAQRSLRR